MTQKGAFEARQGAATQETPSFDERLIDAKLEAVEARTETKFAQLMGKLEALGVRLDGIKTSITDLRGDVSALETKSDNTKVIVISTVIASAIAIVALTFAMIAYGQSVADTLVSTFIAGQEASNGKPSGGTQKGPVG